MSRRLICAAMLAAAALVPAAAQAEDEDARAIVQLSYVATVGKCIQAGIEFSMDDLQKLSDVVRADADLRQLGEADRNRLWAMGQMMSSGSIDAAGCAKAREELATWFPAEALQ
jgi:hypothetical protein